MSLYGTFTDHRPVVSGRKSTSRPVRSFLLGILATALACTLSASVPAQENGNISEEIDGTRSALEQWVETQRVISKEKRDLALAKEILNERIELVQGEIDSLREKIRETEAKVEEADDDQAVLAQELDKLERATIALGETLVTLEEGTQALLSRLPDPIREQVKPLSQRIPDSATDTRLGLGERFANVIGILNEVNKFSRDIHVTSEVRTLADGNTAQVTALYLGIGQGYFTNQARTAAGLGTVSQQGWSWTPADSSAEAIDDAIRIWRNDEIARFVLLPVNIQ